MEINGIAHIHINVNNLKECMPFYEKILGFMGMVPVVKSKWGIYMIGGKTAVCVTRSTPEHRDAKFEQRRIGLHHVCFRAKNRENVEEMHEFLKKEKVKIVHPPEEGPWAPGYYSLLFEDPDGIRLEVNHVPLKGLLGSTIGDENFLKKLPLDTFPGYEDYEEM